MHMPNRHAPDRSRRGASQEKRWEAANLLGPPRLLAARSATRKLTLSTMRAARGEGGGRCAIGGAGRRTSSQPGWTCRPMDLSDEAVCDGCSLAFCAASLGAAIAGFPAHARSPAPASRVFCFPRDHHRQQEQQQQPAAAPAAPAAAPAMELAGSCRCGAVSFTCTSHTPVPFLRCYCTICRKARPGRGQEGGSAAAGERGAIVPCPAGRSALMTSPRRPLPLLLLAHCNL